MVDFSDVGEFVGLVAERVVGALSVDCQFGKVSCRVRGGFWRVEGFVFPGMVVGGDSSLHSNYFVVMLGVYGDCFRVSGSMGWVEFVLGDPGEGGFSLERVAGAVRSLALGIGN